LLVDALLKEESIRFSGNPIGAPRVVKPGAMTTLILRRASVSRRSGEWNRDDFDVFDGERNVGRIYRVNAAAEVWFWGVKFTLTGGRQVHAHWPQELRQCGKPR
jgi:hypothetical protein